ncbi:MAG: glycosyltransferase, partial [Candidatus Bathyarchaeia archaeon]
MRVLVVSEAPVPTLHRSYRSDPLAKYLSAMGHEVSVVCPKPAGDVEGEGYEAISFCHLPEQRYEKYSPISRYRFLASIRKRVEALLDEEKFDVIRPITFPAGYATITAKAKKPPVITNLSDFYSDLYRQFELPLSPLVSMVLRRMERRVIKGSDVLLVDAPTQRTYWRDWGLDVRRCAVLPNGVDRRLFNPEADGNEIRETYRLDETSKLVFYHGDLSRLDGV